MKTKELNFEGFKINGFVMLFVEIALVAIIAWLFYYGSWGHIAGGILSAVWILLLFGFTKLAERGCCDDFLWQI